MDKQRAVNCDGLSADIFPLSYLGGPGNEHESWQCKEGGEA